MKMLTMNFTGPYYIIVILIICLFPLIMFYISAISGVCSNHRQYCTWMRSCLCDLQLLSGFVFQMAFWRNGTFHTRWVPWTENIKPSICPVVHYLYLLLSIMWPVPNNLRTFEEHSSHAFHFCLFCYMSITCTVLFFKGLFISMIISGIFECSLCIFCVASDIDHKSLSSPDNFLLQIFYLCLIS